MKLDVRITGSGQGDIEAEAMSFMRDQFGAEPSRDLNVPTAHDRDGTLLPVLGLLLSIPGTVLAAMQIAEKFELKRRITKLLGEISEKADDQTSVILTLNDTITIDLRTSSADQIIVKLETAAKSE